MIMRLDGVILSFIGVLVLVIYQIGAIGFDTALLGLVVLLIFLVARFRQEPIDA